MNRIYYLLFALSLISVKGIAQSAFSFSTFQEAYQPLPPEKSVWEEAWQYGFSATIVSVPFVHALSAFGYTIDNPDALINSKGQITLRERWLDGYVIISGLGSDLHGVTNMQVATVSSHIEGALGDQIFKLEYNNAGFSVEQPRTSYINFQIWLYERDGAIEMRYGPNGVTTGVQYKKVGIYFANMTGVNVYNSFMLYGNPAAPDTGSGELVSGPGLSDLPAENTVYRFVPQQNFPSVVSRVTLNDPFQICYSADTREIQLYSSEDTAPINQVRLYHMSGSLVNSWRPAGKNRIQLPIGDLPAGIYIVQLTSNNQVYSKKLSVY